MDELPIRRAGRARSWLGAQIGDPLTAIAGGRLAAISFALCGSLAAAASALPLPDHSSRSGLLAIGALAMAIGTGLWVLPWARWPASASLFIVAPAALAIIAAHNWTTGADGYRYGLLFLVLFAWVGLAHPRGTSLRLAPLMVAAYVVPMLATSGMDESAALSSLAYAVPVAVLVGETTAAGAGRLRASEAARRSSEARWRSLVVNASDLIIVMHPDGLVQYATPAVERLFGYPAESTVGIQVLDLIHPDDLAFVLERLALALARPGVGEHIDFRVRRADGTYTWVESIGTNLLHEPSVQGIICNVRDISERKAAEQILIHRARHDALTGLPNRVDLLDTVASRIAGGDAAFALLLLDLDRFKDINDALGHETGDRVLVDVAQRLVAGLQPDDVVARLGGDEFAVVTGGITSDRTAAAFAAELLQVLEGPLEFDGLSLHVGASVGIAVYDAAVDPTNPDESVLLQRADVAMYRAKSSSAAWALFGAEDDDNRPAKLAMVGDLRAALDSGDLVAHYQPQVELATGRVSQVEVLARWTRAGQPISPDVFIPLAEHTGLIGHLTEEILGQALTQCRRWSAVGLPMSVAVNVSASSLRGDGIVDLVQRALDAAGVPPNRLTLEITESALADETGPAVTILRRLRELGIRLSIDDFGSGYSSMAYLKRLPFDEVKIDRSFVTDMFTDPRDRSITRAIIDLAHSLDLTVVGEGVESPALEGLLRDFGCDAAQGFALCRPVSAQEVTAWLAGRVASSPTEAGERHLRVVRADPA